MAKQPDENVDEVPEQEAPAETTPDSPDVAAPETSEGQAFSLLDALAEHNIDRSAFKSDKDAFDWVVDNFRQVHSASERAQQEWRGQQARYEAELMQLRQAQKAAAEAEKKAAEPPKKFEWGKKLPEYNRAWRQFIGPDGQPVPGADPSLPLKLSEYNQFLEQNLQDFFRAPHEYLDPVFQHREQQLLEKVQQQIEAAQQRMLAQTDERLYHEKMGPFLLGQDGRTLTPQGQAYAAAYKQFKELSPEQQQRQFAELATQNMLLMAGQAQGAQPAAPEQDDKKRRSLDKHNRVPSRNGAIKEKAVKYDPHTGWHALIAQEFADAA